MTAGRRRPWARRLGAVLVALLGGAGALYGTRTWTLFPLAAHLAQRYVEERFDADLALTGLRGDGWSRLEADGVELRARPSSPTGLRHFAAQDVRVRFSLVDLIARRPEWLDSVSAATLRLDLDLGRPRPERGDGDGDGKRGLDWVPDLRVRDFSGSVAVAGGRRVDVLRGALRSSRTPEGPSFKLDDVDAQIGAVPDAEPYAGRIDAELVVSEHHLFVHDARFEGADLRLEAHDVTAPYTSLSADALLKDTDGRLELEMDGLLARLGAPADPPSHLKARGALDGGALVIQEAELTAAGGRLRVERGFLRSEGGEPIWSLELTCDVPSIEALKGLMGLTGWTGALSGRANVDGKGSQAFLHLEATADRLELADLRFGTGTVAGALAFDLRHPVALTGSAVVRAAPAWIAGRELDELRGDVTLSRDLLRIEGLEATQPGNRLSVPDLLLPRHGDLARLLADAGGELSLEVTALERLWLRKEGAEPLPEHRLRLSASIADGSAVLKDGELSVAGGEFRATRGSLTLARARSEVLLDLDALFDFPDLAPLGKLLGEDALAGALAGELHASGPIDEPRTVLAAQGTGLSVRGLVLDELALRGEVEGPAVRLETLRLSSSLATLEASGGFELDGTRGAGRVDALRLARGDRELALRAPAAFSFGPGRARIDPLVVEGSSGALELSLLHEGEELSVLAEARALDLDQLLPEEGLGRADGRLSVERTAGELTLDLSASLAGWRVPGFDGEVGAEIDLRQTNERLVVERLEVESSGGEKLSFQGEAPFDWRADPPLAEGPLSFRSRSTEVPLHRFKLPPPLDAIAAQGRGNFTLDLTGTWAKPVGKVEVELSNLAWTAEPGGELSASLMLADGSVGGAITAGQTGRFSAESDARLATDVDARRLIGRDFAPLLEAPLEAELTVRSSDLAWIAERVPGVRRAAGSLLANMHVRGSLRDPHWDGRLVVGGGEVKLNSDLPALANVKGSVHLSDDEVRLAGVTAELGGAPIQVGGSVAIPESGPLELALTLRGERLLLARDPEILLRADADLKLAGTWQAPALSGKLTLRRSWLSKRVTLLDLQPSGPHSRARGVPLFSIREPPFSDMTLALEVESAEPIVLRGNVARGGLRPDLHVTGTGEVPKLEGTVFLDTTTVSLPGAPVDFRGGTLTFDPRNPFVPSLSLVGTAEKFGHDITVVVTGPYDDPEVELSATPPLSQEDIVLILLAGRPPTGFAQGGALEATQTVAIYLASDFASAWLGGDSGDSASSWLERVEVVSGREISQNGVPTLEVRLRVSEDFPIDGTRAYLSYEEDVYEDQNLGVRFAFRLR